MKSVTTNRFRSLLPNFRKMFNVAQEKLTSYGKLILVMPACILKEIEEQPAVYSVRVGLSYRALGVKEEDTIIWFWIGSHEEYNKLISQI